MEARAGSGPLSHPAQVFTTVPLVEILWPEKKKTTGHLCVFINGLLAFPKPPPDQGDHGVGVGRGVDGDLRHFQG